MNIRYASILTVICLLVSWLSATDVFANPTGKQPNLALDAHGTIDAAKGLVASLYKIYDEEEPLSIELSALQKTPERHSEKRLGKSASRLWKARRDAEHLKLMGEPAAYDLARKFDMLIQRLDNAAHIFMRTPPGAQATQRAQTKLQRELPKLTRFLQQASAALQRGNLEVFEKQMEAKGIALNYDLVMINYQEKGRYSKQFGSVLGQGDALLSKQRRAEYTKQAGEAVTQQLGPALAFSSEAARIRDEIASSGSATLGKDTTGGPAEALAHVATLWGNASAGLLRATAITWAFSGQSDDGEFDDGGGSGRSDAGLQPNASQLKAMALKALASIIEAAAASTPPDKVQTVYCDLLKQISVVDRRSGSSLDQDVSKACQPALGKLAAKDPALAARIAAYRRGTSEALRWRQQFALQQAKNLAADIPDASNLLASKSEVESTPRSKFTGKPGVLAVAPATFDSPANWMVHEAASRLVGKPISEKRMTRLTPTSRTAIVPFSSNHYANIPVSLSTDAEIADLKTALVVDDSHAPLTIESADAISAAELQDYEAVSGVIQQVHLESAVTRMIGLPDVAYTLQPLGQMPQFSAPAAPISQTCWRLDIKPDWAHHRYFTVRQASETQR